MAKTIRMTRAGKAADVHPNEVEHMAKFGWEASTAPVPDSPEDIAMLKKKELVELLEAHDGDTSGNVAELRARLTEIMFIGE